MNVRWSHCVLKVRDLEMMVEFYCKAFGWQVADRGDLGGDTEIVFLSGSSSDHHQMALMGNRPEDDKGGALDHNAFRVDSVADVRTVFERMQADDRVAYAAPVTHGNAVSVYFADPEGNGIEIFCDTPWHVRQPVLGKWDPSQTDDEILAGIRDRYSDDESFMPMEQYRSRQAEVFGEAAPAGA